MTPLRRFASPPLSRGDHTCHPAKPGLRCVLVCIPDGHLGNLK